MVANEELAESFVDENHILSAINSLNVLPPLLLELLIASSRTRMGPADANEIFFLDKLSKTNPIVTHETVYAHTFLFFRKRK